MKGAIVFLDILGYQSFLENNSATESALRVLELITTLPKTTHAELSKSWIDGKFDKTVVDSLQHVVFSDTVVLLLPYGTDDESRIRASVAYLVVCAGVLATKMFDAGLPMRGAIHEGEFIVKESCFAGRGIVESYRLCSQLDFSGLIVSPELLGRLTADQDTARPFFHKEFFRRFVVPILSPLKIGKSERLEEQRLTHLNWLMFTAGHLRAQLESDVIQCVMSRFWAHDKDCPTSVDGKIRNTCKMIRRLRMSLPPPPPPPVAPQPQISSPSETAKA